MSKEHYVPRVGTMSYLEFSISNKGVVDIFSLSYSSIGIVILGGTSVVTLTYNNNRIFHLKIFNLTCSSNCTIHYYDTPTSLTHCTF